MPILDANTLAAARNVTNATLTDSAMIYSPHTSDNGLGSETVYGLRDTQLCRVVSLSNKDVSNALRQLNKSLYMVTMGSGATIAVNEKVTISGSVDLTGIVVQDNSTQTDDLVICQFILASPA